MDIIFKVTGHVSNLQDEFGDKYKSLLIATGKALYGGVPCEIAAKFNVEYKKDIWSMIQSKAIFVGDLVEAEVELTGQQSKNGKVFNNLELRSVVVLQKAGGQTVQHAAAPMQAAPMQTATQPAPACPAWGHPKSFKYELTLSRWVVWNAQERRWGFFDATNGQWWKMEDNVMPPFVEPQQPQAQPMAQQMGTPPPPPAPQQQQMGASQQWGSSIPDTYVSNEQMPY